MNIVRRAEAKAHGLLRYFTGKPCKHGHIAERLVSNGSCMECFRIRQQTDDVKAKRQAYRDQNIERIRESHRAKYAANPEHYKEKTRRYYEANKKKARRAMQSYADRTKDKRRVYIREYMKARKKVDLQFKLIGVMRNFVARCIRAGGEKTKSRTEHLFGYSPAQLKTHLESLFSNGMNWENYGEWHIDHIRPLSSFDLTREDEIRLANSLHNLRPMWAAQNIKKSDSWNNQLTLI